MILNYLSMAIFNIREDKRVCHNSPGQRRFPSTILLLMTSQADRSPGKYQIISMITTGVVGLA